MGSYVGALGERKARSWTLQDWQKGVVEKQVKRIFVPLLKGLPFPLVL